MRVQLGLVLAVLVASAQSAAGAGFAVVPLVSDQAGVAPNTDSDLVNPWGLSHGGGTAPLWVSDNGTDKSTLYNRTTGVKSALVVAIPGGVPTGTVFVPSGSGFSLNGHDSLFLFDSEAGMITGWSSGTTAVVAVNESGQGSVYKGLALDSATKLLFAADFANNRVEVFDNNFAKVREFTDETLPKHYAPFNVAVFGGKVYVAFARRERGGSDEVGRPHLGFVEVFSTDGVLQQHLIENGLLNAPWGMTIAPSGFGTLAGALLVGNFGDGRINAYDATTGTFLATLLKPNGKALRVDGLWALDAGPGSNVTLSAGPNAEADGLIALIQPQ